MSKYNLWLNRTMAGGDYDFDDLHRRLASIKPDKQSIKKYFALKVALEIRKNDLEQAKKSLIQFKKIASEDVAIYNFFISLIAYINGDMEKSELYADKCLDLNSDFITAIKIKMRILLKDFESAKKKDKFKRFFEKHPANIRSSIDYFIENQRYGANLNKNIDEFNHRVETNHHLRPTKSLEPISWTSEGFSFHENEYKDLCDKAIDKIETLFSIRIKKDYSYMQNRAAIEDTMQVIGRDFSRAKPSVNNMININNKGLQMLCSPGYWINSQNHLLCFILSEIHRLNKKNNKQKINIHEVGPGCGYILNTLSGISNVVLTGSDCYSSSSFNIDQYERQDINFSEMIDNKPLELFCYYLINSLTGTINCISNSPIGLNSFPPEIIASDLVYSHLPVFDQHNGGWSLEDWKSFFENVFYAPNSRVKSIIIAANNHSKSLHSFCATASKTKWRDLGAEVFEGEICNGLVVIVRKDCN